MSEIIYIDEFIKTVPSRQRGRGCFIFTKEYESQDKWAQKLADLTGAKHINLLDVFMNDSKLTNDLSSFGVDEFFKYLKSYKEDKLLIVSGIDFLKATWAGIPGAKTKLATQLSNWSSNPALVLVLQYDKDIASYNFTDRYQYRFVIKQEDTYQI